MRAFLLLLLLAVPVFFINLGVNAIWDANEAFYVETPRQMVLSGDYVNPTFNGQPRFNKPVLSYWMVAGLYRVFGVSVTVERVGIALGALGIIFATFLIGRALRSPPTGVLAALFVATAPYFVFWSRRIFIDIYVTLFMALALACFVLAERHPSRRRLYLLLMYVAIGLGVLTKGPVALALPAVVCLSWLASERRLGDLRRLMILPGALIVLAIAAPWYVAIYMQHGWGYIKTFFIDENLGRYTSPVVPADRALWFYVPSLFGHLFPWALLFVVPLVTGWRDGLRRLLWLWVVVIVGVFSFSQSKQDLYILPVLPAVAVLVADGLVGHAWGAGHRGFRILLAAVCIVCIAVAGLVVWLFGSGYYAIAGATAVGAILGLAAAIALGLMARARYRDAVIALAAGLVIVNYLLVWRALPDVERLRPVPALAQTFRDRASPDARLGFYHMSLPSLVFYADRSIDEIGLPDHAMAYFHEPKGAWAIMSEEKYQEVRPRVPVLCVADRRPLFNIVSLRNLVSRTPPPDVLLVTNQCR